ncbi:MAG: hypothetical protein JWQ57_1029 [Mucilaginibacter sp.]|nr:hypothetical protein [Mucilaginibacter sp.]
MSLPPLLNKYPCLHYILLLLLMLAVSLAHGKISVFLFSQLSQIDTTCIFSPQFCNIN